MTEQTNTLPTPANDRYKAEEPRVQSVKVGFFIEEGARLEASLTAAEAIEQALKAEPWLQKSKVATKSKAIRILLNKAWSNHSEQVALRDLMKEADAERAVLLALAQNEGGVERAQQALVEVASGNAFDTSRMIYAVESLRWASVEHGHWDTVRYIIENHGKTPVEALRLRIDEVTKELVNPFRHRTLNRSSSMVSNLIEDMDNEVNARWLEKAKAVLGR